MPSAWEITKLRMTPDFRPRLNPQRSRARLAPVLVMAAALAYRCGANLSTAEIVYDRVRVFG